jgi:hypothetical protein
MGRRVVKTHPARVQDPCEGESNMSIVSNHFPEVIQDFEDQLDGPGQDDWQDYEHHLDTQASSQAAAKVQDLIETLGNLIDHAEATKYQRARGKAMRHQWHGQADAYKDCRRKLTALVGELA